MTSPLPPAAAARSAAPALCAALLALLAVAAPAAADQVICAEGAGAGQCTEPTAVDVDRAEGLVYVADAGNEEVDVYDAEGGAQLDSWEVGFSPGSLAVDNDTETPSPAAHDVYVFDRDNGQVVRFNPAGEVLAEFGEGMFVELDPRGFDQVSVDVGPGGLVYVADNSGDGTRRVQKFDHGGEPIAVPAACEQLEPGEFGRHLRGFAVDSEGGFYLASEAGRPVEHYDSSCAWLEEGFHPSFNIRALGLDGEDDLFVSDSTGLGATTTYLYDSTHTLLKVFYGNGTQLDRAISLAPLSNAVGDLFLAEQASSPGLGRVVQISLPPPGPVVHPDPELTEADPVSATKATLASQVNPEGKASQFRFEYVDDAAYQEDLEEGGDGFAGAQSSTSEEVPAPESLPPFLEGLPLFALSPVSAQIGCTDPADPPQAECLKPETAYRFRAVASNEDSEPEERFGPVSSFETKPPLEINAVWSSRVGVDAARLSAEATAFGIPLAGHFQYVEEAICLADEEELGEGHCFDRAEQTAELDFGSGEEPLTRTAQLTSLKRGTAYRYRIVLENPFVPEGEPGEALTFATYALPAPEACPNGHLRAGPAAKLPDCRAYEMVSPVDKGGGEIVVRLAAVQGSPPAELNKSAAAVPAAGAGLTYSSARAFGDAPSAPTTSQYLASRSPDDGDGVWEPGEGWSTQGISPRREGIVFAPNNWDIEFRVFSEDLRFGWLTPEADPPLSADAIAGYPNLYRRDNATDSFAAICPVKPRPETSPSSYELLPQGFSEDGSRTIFSANDKLSAEAADTGAPQLYACEIGVAEPVLVSVLPGSEAHGGGAAVGTRVSAGNGHRGFNLHNAVSTDAERVYWTDAGEGAGRIYLRERPFAEGEECAGGSAPCTVAVSEAVGGEGSDADAVFWTADRDGSVAIFGFTEGPLAGELYEYDAESGEADSIAGGVSGLADCNTAGGLAASCGGLAGWSEDAEVLYLVSSEDLAEDAVAGSDNLYRYDASAPAGEKFELVARLPGGTSNPGCARAIDNLNPLARCARATPDGGALAFSSRDPLTGYDNAHASSGEPTTQVFLYDAAAGEFLCVSCNPSGSRPRGGSGIPHWESAFQASRLLSADGRRLFFESNDALLPADSNGALDVYQWERAGKGGCEASDANHFPANGGCIDLVSSGEDSNDSEFLDASADGRDVFFKTSESLWGPDPGLIDVYDARVGGGFPEPAPPRPPCEGEACQSPPPAPQQPAGASALFAGPGNLAAPRPRCARSARQARRLSRRAKRLRRAARRAKAPARSRRLHRRAKGAAKRAGRNSRQAKRCRRARARAAARGARR